MGEAKEEDLDRGWRRGVSLSPVAVGVDRGGGERRWLELAASELRSPSKTEEELLPELLEDEELMSESESYVALILDLLRMKLYLLVAQECR